MEILLYGIIGEPADGLDAYTIAPLIRSATGDIAVRINSAGGLVFDGLAIFEALNAYRGGRVTVYIDGLAASSASVIAMAGNPIIMAESAMMMIHDPQTASDGNSGALRADAAKLDKVAGQLAGIYARRSGMHASRVAALMAAETWFTADEAKAAGLVDQTSLPSRAVALADVSGFGFHNVPLN